jgi:signal transduction histidine kinase
VKRFQVVEKIEANGGEIQYVFTQLIKNAFRAMDGRGGRLILSTQSSKDAVEIKVSDEGVGIPEEHLRHIFDPFFTTKKDGEGKGLGLNIVYRIVTKYEGTIEVESKEEVGTTFTVKFPTRRE